MALLTASIMFLEAEKAQISEKLSATLCGKDANA